MLREILYGLAGLLLLAYAADLFYNVGDDPNEPPRIRSRVPLIGHVLGLMRQGPTYYQKTSNSTKAEIYILGCFNFKVYISASSRLLPFIQKQSRALSFRPFLQLVARKYGDASDAAYEIFAGSLPDDLSQSVKMSLAPGRHLDDLSLRMGSRVLVEIDALIGSPGNVPLLSWARHAVVQATSCAVYGEQHPFLDPEIETAYWKWMTYLTAHLVGWLDVTKRGYAAREKVFQSYIKYCKHLPQASSHLMKEHQRVLGEAGISSTDKAKQAAIFTIASFSNSAPTLYWTLWELFSRQEILVEVRAELVKHAVANPETGHFELDVSALKAHCPLLLSVFQETQRTRHVNPSFRKVLTDTLLDDQYLLKEGNYLQVPGNVIHCEPGIWGPTALQFDPYRFMPNKGGGERDASSSASGFVPWGAAPYLCPARQFAATEILIIAALLAMRVDMEPASGVWDKSPAVNHADLATLSPPVKDVDMNVRVREEWAGKWTVKMGESRSRVPLASG
ncbi:5-beta-cholestane-3-alpha,7-alpha-diol 12-alpha-hydroxylase [Colletotrichum tanaceti]|uniref:5-beta-cholestane-3-alpha,7-alpha-diol 12-alpha-hydroxylase n=1 Tax=Colletotrichum tanaceti TaxID=1306861 RepID=A0A4U6X8P7_9PEZI|nr:5-beta-cholestane-3-alpha,7-alpha-diol 12-alpha-hydroxylase [Colletotrichum tanaceti]TKW51928.1 5-beta-cholestane-3-alpha,7-alpha-diol 12-alpha-hydroxylase [Colletotrichum tanaceti]